jgi:hypothetical protein
MVFPEEVVVDVEEVLVEGVHVEEVLVAEVLVVGVLVVGVCRADGHANGPKQGVEDESSCYGLGR